MSLALCLPRNMRAACRAMARTSSEMEETVRKLEASSQMEAMGNAGVSGEADLDGRLGLAPREM